MKRIIALSIILLVSVGGTANANPWYVATDGDGSDGLSWATAWQEVQTAINAAGDDDTIYVKGETFTLQQPVPVQEEGLLVWTNKPLTIRGGYVGSGSPGALGATPTVLRNTAETAHHETSNPTAVDRQRILYINAVTNGTLVNVTLRGGRIGSTRWNPDIPGTKGAGVYIDASSNLVLNAMVIEENVQLTTFSRDNHGGGIYARDTTGILTNSVVRNNVISAKGGHNRGVGLYIEGGAWTVRDSVIRDNAAAERTTSATFYGAGVYVNGGTHVLRNVVLSRNGAAPLWIGISNDEDRMAAVVSSRVRGSALYVDDGTVTLENATVYRNAVQGVRREGGSLTVRDSILWNNGSADVVGTVTLDHCNVSDGSAENTNGNISVDPGFVRGLFLAPDSDCVEAGSRSVAVAGLTGYTTRTNGASHTGDVDLGYHYPPGTAVQTLYVDAVNGDDGNGGLSAGDAFRTIGKALSQVEDGTHVHIAPGTYNLALGETFPLMVRYVYGVQLLGAAAATTIIDATPPTRGSRGLEMGWNYPDARVEGLTIRGVNHVNADLWYPDELRHGGGLSLMAVEGAVVDCIVRDNLLEGLEGWNPVRNNRRGAGMYMRQSPVTVSNSLIEANAIAAWRDEHVYGAGLYADDGGLVTHSIIRLNTNTVGRSSNNNARGAFGGGVWLSGSGLRNSLVVSNVARVASGGGASFYKRGDGVYITGGTVAIESATIADNAGEGLRRNAGTVSVQNSILWNNGVDVTGTVAVAWSNVGVTDPVNTPTDSISADPLFLDAPAGDYRLQVQGELSPSINTGNPTPQAWMIGGVDLDGNDRILNDRVDQGAYENLVPPPGTLILLR